MIILDWQIPTDNDDDRNIDKIMDWNFKLSLCHAIFYFKINFVILMDSSETLVFSISTHN